MTLALLKSRSNPLTHWTGAVLLVGGIYTLWLRQGRYDADTEALVSSSLLSLNAILAAGVSLTIWRDPRFTPQIRRGVLFLALAALSELLAEGIWLGLQQLQGPTYPSLADVFYLLYYPLMLTALLSFPLALDRRHGRRERLEIGLDLAMVMVACLMFLWYYVLEPMLAQETPSVQAVVALAYPVGDLMILAGLIALLWHSLPYMPLPALIALAVAETLTILPDVVFAYLQVNRISFTYPALNLCWNWSVIAGLLSVSWIYYAGGSYRRSASPKQVRFQQFFRWFVPYMGVSYGLLLLVGVINHNQVLDLRLRGLLYIALLLVALVLIRQYLALRENIAMYQTMHTMATTDQLTKIYNRHYFNEAYPAILLRAEKEAQPLSLMLIDIDRFKQINDNLGHLRGDEVLQGVAQLLTRKLRDQDLLARFGGDEFVVVLPGADAARSAAIALRLQAAVRAQPIAAVSVSVSIGVATYEPGQGPETLLEAADRALYRQKALVGRPAPPAVVPQTVNQN